MSPKLNANFYCQSCLNRQSHKNSIHKRAVEITTKQHHHHYACWLGLQPLCYCYTSRLSQSSVLLLCNIFHCPSHLFRTTTFTHCCVELVKIKIFIPNFKVNSKFQTENMVYIRFHNSLTKKSRLINFFKLAVRLRMSGTCKNSDSCLFFKYSK